MSYKNAFPNQKLKNKHLKTNKKQRKGFNVTLLKSRTFITFMNFHHLFKLLLRDISRRTSFLRTSVFGYLFYRELYF